MQPEQGNTTFGVADCTEEAEMHSPGAVELSEDDLV